MSDHTIATALVKAQKAHKRKPADFYPTPPNVTFALMRHLAVPRGAHIWEPASGDGAMMRVLRHFCPHVYGSDLRKESTVAGDRGVDFLRHPGRAGVDWIITNPPFKVAEGFIRKALSITPNVAMLLSNQYWHAQEREALFNEHKPAQILPLLWRPAFLRQERGSSPMMNVFWVVWRDGDRRAQYQLLPRPPEADVSAALVEDDDLVGLL